MVTEQGPSGAPQLSDDIWAKILVHVEGGVGDGLALRYDEPYSLYKAQAEYYRLRLVCRKFDQLFRHQGQLCRGLALPVCITDEMLQNLEAWLREHSSYVRNLAAYCGSPGLDAAIEFLAGSPPKLASVFLCDCSNSALNKLSVFTSLTTCELVEPQGSMLDLAPLQPLANLQKLILTEGLFTTTQLPPHLTNLTLSHASMTAAEQCSCVTSLKKLRLFESQLIGLHPDGIAACSAVELLTCVQGQIHAGMGHLRLDCSHDLPFNVPPGLSSLNRLKSLSLAIASTGAMLPGVGPLGEPQYGHDLSCLQGLTSLEELSVHSFFDDVFLPSRVTDLHKLSVLSLSVAPNEGGDEAPCVILHVDWPALQMLKSLCIDAPAFACGRSIVGLATAKQLAHITWGHSAPYDAESTKCFAALMYKLAKYRPEVVVMLDKDAIEDVF